jgi:hypothetical protein
LTVLTDTPYLLAQGETVQAIVQAYNTNGWGDLSDVNPTGALIQVKPHKMGEITNGATTDEE